MIDTNIFLRGWTNLHVYYAQTFFDTKHTHTHTKSGVSADSLHKNKNGLCSMTQVLHDTGHMTVTRWLHHKALNIVFVLFFLKKIMENWSNSKNTAVYVFRCSDFEVSVGPKFTLKQH